MLVALPLTLAGCSGDEGDADVQPGNVEVKTPDVDEDADDDAGPDETPGG